MQLNDYQARALTTDSFVEADGFVPVTDMAVMATILGLVGESGEVAEKIKKIIPNNKSGMRESERQEIIKELGDVLWYTAVLAKYLGSDFETVAKQNLAKLSDRNQRGVISSKGDDR